MQAYLEYIFCEISQRQNLDCILWRRYLSSFHSFLVTPNILNFWWGSLYKIKSGYSPSPPPLPPFCKQKEGRGAPSRFVLRTSLGGYKSALCADLPPETKLRTDKSVLNYGSEYLLLNPIQGLTYFILIIDPLNLTIDRYYRIVSCFIRCYK